MAVIQKKSTLPTTIYDRTAAVASANSVQDLQFAWTR